MLHVQVNTADISHTALFSSTKYNQVTSGI